VRRQIEPPRLLPRAAVLNRPQQHGLKVFAGINEALATMKKFAAAAAVEQRLLAAAQAGTGTAGSAGGAVGARGLGGGATILGEGALAGLGGAASIAGVGVLIAGAGIAVHDILAKLTGKFDTLTGIVGDWIETTKHNVELEKSIERQQQAREWRLERHKQQAEQTQKYFEGRERIEEAQVRQRAVGGHFNRLEHYIGLSRNDSTNVGAKSELELQANAEESGRRRIEQREREREAAQAARNFLRTQRELEKTTETNKWLAKGGTVELDLGPFHNTIPTREQGAARQKEIDEAEAAVVPEGWRHGLKQGWNRWFGDPNETAFERIKARQELAKVMNLQPTGPVPQDLGPQLTKEFEGRGIDPRSTVMSAGQPRQPDVARQQALEAELVKRAK
jgi:hypothetical protein